MFAHDGQIPTQFIMSFKILVSIIKNEDSDMKVLPVVVVSDISVSVATAVAGELLLIFVGRPTSLADHLIFLYEADTKLSTCSVDKVLSLILANFVYLLPLNLGLVYNDAAPLIHLQKTANFSFLFSSISI